MKKLLPNKLHPKYSNETPSEIYLFEKLFYDVSGIDTSKENVELVIVFGETLQSTIQRPIVNSQTYSPDLAYVIKRKYKPVRLHIIVKAYLQMKCFNGHNTGSLRKE
ncbi:hypothetical protein CSV80_14385 [Sporosarcina sp. P12(2017)]|uniref:hypothetical protein n=1 Tax=unclassified Sporosarcina TaxID=2647733 RepID=UPI000C1630C3|nr:MULTISPECIES: hypothetical protein [unclassified Sporosarcina]PIC56435.1 hypothetical protein CSV81_14250 [Sporosarcina sp. P10]PIC59732.1 hypothetical protein CSV80_14385 [Sporosarcina sp. P12(2017)]